MGFEAKHSYFKSLQRQIQNFINPPKLWRLGISSGSAMNSWLLGIVFSM
jgi:hypothetical protein